MGRCPGISGPSSAGDEGYEAGTGSLGKSNRIISEGRPCAQFHNFTVTTMRTSGEAPATSGRWHVSGRIQGRLQGPGSTSLRAASSVTKDHVRLSRKKPAVIPQCFRSAASRMRRTCCSASIVGPANEVILRRTSVRPDGSIRHI